jgi:hypothetical protein
MKERQRPPWLKLSLVDERVMARNTEEEAESAWEVSRNGARKRSLSTNTEED